MKYGITDFDITRMVFSMWEGSLNRESRSIALCLASKFRVEATPEFLSWVDDRLKDLVRSGDIRRQRFLPKRPFYTIA